MKNMCITRFKLKCPQLKQHKRLSSLIGYLHFLIIDDLPTNELHTF